MKLVGGWILPVTWCLLGVTIVVASLAARRSRGAYTIAIWAISFLWVVAGAGANLVMLLDGATYTDFASGSPIPFVRDTWESLVVPHHHFFIGLLIAFEAAVGLAVLRPGRARVVTLGLLILFNVTLVVFGWAFLVWAAPLVLSLVLLMREGARNPQPEVHQVPRVSRLGQELSNEGPTTHHGATLRSAPAGSRRVDWSHVRESD